MSVSSRHILTGAVAAFALMAAGGAAVAGGGPDKGARPAPSYGGVSGNRVKTPAPNYQPTIRVDKVRPNFAPNINIPAVNVQAPNIVVNQGNVAITQSNIVLGGATVLGGGGFFGAVGGFATPSTPVSPSALGSLNVEGADQIINETVTQQVPVTEESCAPRVTQTVSVRPVQAVCLDDKGAPHPASRISAEETVADGFDGELFRCLAGTHMQVTLGQVVNGQSSFDQGETFSCRKGEALVHGAGGNLTCAPATPQRNCNERSLLRRHGPGVKLVRTLARHETCVPEHRTTYRTVTKQVQRTVPNISESIVLDGGVGQGVF